MNKDCCLHYYNPKKSLFIETDASKVGLGAALLQMDDKECVYEEDLTDDTLSKMFQFQPVAYALKSLTSTEQNYSNIEREALDALHSLENSTTIALDMWFMSSLTADHYCL